MKHWITPTMAPSLVAEGARLQGELYFNAAVHVDGLIDGNLHQESLETTEVGRQGWIQGSVISEGPVIISGKVDGHIVSKIQIVLEPTAFVRGNLTAPRIQVRPGACLEGTLQMENASRSSLTLRAAA